MGTWFQTDVDPILAIQVDDINHLVQQECIKKTLLSDHVVTSEHLNTQSINYVMTKALDRDVTSSNSLNGIVLPGPTSSRERC